MLAGLLIATHDAEDRPAMLTATLPFGGGTLLEYQARLLIGSGAAQIVVVVARLTPELLGAINRIGRRGVAVDVVRSAAEAAEKLHPLARVVMLADGLTTRPELVEEVAREGGDALLVFKGDEDGSVYERVGSGMRWAGIARLDARRLAELAAMPRDYDVQSTLVRLASQADALHIVVPAGVTRNGHGIDHRESGLALRSRQVLAAMVAGRDGWFDRYVIAPLARLAIPTLVARSIRTSVAVGAGAVLGVAGLAMLAAMHATIGLWLATLASCLILLTISVADLRDETELARALRQVALGFPALALLLFGYDHAQASGRATAVAVAIMLIVIGALGERGGAASSRGRWWGSAPVYLLMATLGATAGLPIGGVVIAAAYATATTAAVIERLRQHA